MATSPATIFHVSFFIYGMKQGVNNLFFNQLTNFPNIFIEQVIFPLLIWSATLLFLKTHRGSNSNHNSSGTLVSKSVPTLATPWSVDCQVPPSIGFSRKILKWVAISFSSKNTGVGCHFLLQGIFLIQGSNPGLLHCRQIL